MAQTGKCGLPAIEQFALVVAVPIGTAEHVLDEASRIHTMSVMGLPMWLWVFQPPLMGGYGSSNHFHVSGRALGDKKSIEKKERPVLSWSEQSSGWEQLMLSGSGVVLSGALRVPGMSKVEGRL